MSSFVTKLPLDVLTDCIFPFLDTVTLLNLGTTSKAFYELINGNTGEVVWRRKINQELNFPLQSTARATGWKKLYRSIVKPQVYVWGASSHGRLAIPSGNRNKWRELGAGANRPMRLWFKSPIVDIVAGGWSFHTMSAGGNVRFWGTMNAETHDTYNRLSHPGHIVYTPMELPPEVPPISSISCGRTHALALAYDGSVWEWKSWGRIVKVEDATNRWATSYDTHPTDGGNTNNKPKKVIQQQAGWYFSAILTEDGTVYLWWHLSNSFLSHNAVEAGETQDTKTVTFTVQIPTIEVPKPSKRSVGSDKDEDERITSIACGDHCIIALTSNSRVYKLNTAPDQVAQQADDPTEEEIMEMPKRRRAWLQAALLSGRRHWEYLPKFSEMDEISRLGPFKKSEGESTEVVDPLPLPSPDTRITHVSAHFESFFAYSPAGDSQDSTHSLVLKGNVGDNADSDPEIIRELQGKGVIKITQGDWHNGALTKDGELLVFGVNNSGCLGLGPNPDGTAGDREHEPQPHPPGARIRIHRGWNHQPRVDHPQPVDFKHQEEESTTAAQNKFVFNVAFGGHHSSALAVSLSDEDDSLPEGESYCDELSESEQHVSDPGPPRGSFRGRVFMGRLGYPARGIRRGFAGNEPR